MNRIKTTEDYVAAQNLLDFFMELIEASKNLLKYYLSEDVVLDWFGQTVRGQKNVASFIKTKINPIKHILSGAKPVNRIGFRDTHVVTVSRPLRRTLRSAFLSPPRISLPNTPKKQPKPSTSTNRDPPPPSSRRGINKLNFDNNENNNIDADTKKTPSNTNNNNAISRPLEDSPRKRRKLSPKDGDTDVVEEEPELEGPEVTVKYLTCEGHVEFHRPSLKKLQGETKWQRPCKLHLAYDCGKDVKDSTFYLIIYEGNVKCRRNLMAAFETDEPES
ncbi:uncharacterized protein LOC115890387 [Sitophilus oryzae]|uniref:Uncharacterized protein LOC115890387 n=1 Tax=Sitophilus oryzae TaxID=7048 RepID=A0A6J2YQX3_SITOR|nr:uncharacterized protein LOC115890387 [Sitophilus oryzae]XP_030766468.1 uncharacterized protein LOC115890387 [Sitophilus oryzae]